MKIFCEVMVSDIMPAFRAILANELIKRYDLSQIEVSKRLGMTQPAISQYIGGLRGYNSQLLQSNKTIVKFIKNLSSQIAYGKIRPGKVQEKICEVCELIRKEKIIRRKTVHSYCSHKVKK